jgi:hypothetical protein
MDLQVWTCVKEPPEEGDEGNERRVVGDGVNREAARAFLVPSGAFGGLSPPWAARFIIIIIYYGS